MRFVRRTLAFGCAAFVTAVWAAPARGVPVLGSTPSTAPPGSVFFSLPPCRIFDTRMAGSPLVSGVSSIFPIAGQCNVPPSAIAISANVTAVLPSAAGHLTAYPGDGALPNASLLNFSAGQTRSNNAILLLALDGSGTVALRPFVLGGGTVNVILDTNGYFEPSSLSLLSLSPGSILAGSPDLPLTANGTGFVTGTILRFDGFDLATQVLAPDRLTATVPAARLGTAGVVPVQVVGPDGGATPAVLFTVDAPLALSTLSPSGVAAGSPDFLLTLGGAGFQRGAVARLGGVDLATTYVGSGMLTATVPAARVAGPGSSSMVVANPGGGVSAALPFTVKGLSVTGISPTSGPVGTPVTVTGSGLDLPLTILFGKQGGGTLGAPVQSASASVLGVAVPAGAATGPVLFRSGGLTLTGPVFTVTPSKTFAISGGPATGVLFPGSRVHYGITATSAQGFTGLIDLQVSGLPAGLTATFPPHLTAGQTGDLLLTAPSGQPTGLTSFTVTATASIEGQTVTRTLPLAVDVRPVVTSFLGRVVSGDSLELPLAGVIVTFQGKDDAGNPTGCSLPSIRTDAGGGFLFTNLPAACTGKQLVHFDGLTVTQPAGQLYTGVHISFTLSAGIVNTAPVTTHLLRIDHAETVLLRQNWPSTQIVTFQTLPGLRVEVYPGTILSNLDGSTPDPFPLLGVQVPLDRLPDDKKLPVGQILTFMVAFQPDGASASQPVAIDFPNVLNLAPGSSALLLTLDPRIGTFGPYGNGTVSADGLSIVADADPARPGHRYGISYFDWHGPMTTPPPNETRATTGQEQCAVLTGEGVGVGTTFHPLEGAQSVEYATGSEITSSVDAAVSGIVLPVALVRSYRSDFASFAGPFGLGTTLNFSYIVLAGMNPTQPMIEVALPNGRRVPYVRQADGSYLASTTPFARGSSLLWDSAQGEFRLTTIDGSALLFKPAFFVAARASLSGIVDRHGNRIDLVRGVGSNNVEILERIVASNGQEISLQYDVQNRIRTVTDFAGRTTIYGYDSAGHLASVTDPAGGVTGYGYDIQNRLTTVTNTRGIVVVTKEYDAVGRVHKETFPDGGQTTYDYVTTNPADPASPVVRTTVTDPLGHTTSYRFRNDGALLDVTDANGQVVSYTIDPLSGRYQTRKGLTACSSCGNPGIGDQSYEYDNQGRLTKVTDAEGHSTTFTYPAIGQVPASVTDALSRTTNFTQNAVGDVTDVTDPANKVWHFTYDTAGRPVTVTDPNQHTTTFTYGVDGRPDSVTDPLGRKTGFTYDDAGRLVSTIAPDGTTEYLGYDALDRITRVEDALGHLTRFDYDPVGNLRTLTDPKGNATTFEYDNLDRLMREIAPDGSARVYGYDLNGNVKSRTDRNGHTANFTYDILDRLHDALYQDGTILHFEWDAAGRLLAADDDDGGRVERSYDVLGHLKSEISPTGWLNYEHDAIGRRTQRTGPDGVTTYTYTTQGQVESITNGAMSVSFSYDDAGRRATALAPNNVTTAYTYDDAGQVSRIDYVGPGGFSDFRAYTYDLNGRVSSVIGNSLNSPLPSQQATTFDSRNRVLEMNGRLFQYDREGRLLSDGLWSYSWNDAGLLLGLSGGQGFTNYGYDGLGRRFLNNFRGAITTTLSDGLDISHIVENNISTDYLNGLHLDEDWAAKVNDTVQAIGRDLLGSSVFTLGDHESTQEFSYDEYGATDRAPRLGFGGREHEGNLVYLRARYLDTITGRFINGDPFRSSYNLYGYAKNSPTSLVDPLGLQGEEIGQELIPDAVDEFLDDKGALGIASDLRDLIKEPTKPLIPGVSISLAVIAILGAEVEPLVLAVEIAQGLLRNHKLITAVGNALLPESTLEVGVNRYSIRGPGLCGYGVQAIRRTTSPSGEKSVTRTIEYYNQATNNSTNIWP